CLFGIPTDLPEPRDDESGHGAAVARVLVELAHASDGGMFVLFTSHAALRRAAEAVRGSIGGRWPLFVQGEGQRDHLLRRFREACLRRRGWWASGRMCGAAAKSDVRDAVLGPEDGRCKAGRGGDG